MKKTEMHSVDELCGNLVALVVARIGQVVATTVKNELRVEAGVSREEGSRVMDMRCRVAGCREASRGPRFGFICDGHRGTMSPAEQKEARRLYNEARKTAKARLEALSA